MNKMIYIYRLLFPLFLLVFSPYYLKRMIRRGGYAYKMSYRLGNWPVLKKKKKGIRRIWIQAVSVGELASISKLIRKLFAAEKIEIALSGTTSTGLSLSQKKYEAQLLAHGPFPLDWLPFSRKAWKRINPDLAIVVDSELWPEHFYQALSRSTPLLVINARLSERSFSRLRFIGIFRSLLVPPKLRVLAASEKQKKRWMSLGLEEQQVQCSGNLKLDADESKQIPLADKLRLRREFGFSENSLVIAGISTWKGEEKMLLKTIDSLRSENVDIRLLLIPRHAERRAEIERNLKNFDFSYHLRSLCKQAPEDNIIYLADTTGELSILIQTADLAFLGKTLPPHHGGQNPIEAVSFGIPLVVGPNHQNFQETCDDMFVNKAALKCREAKEVGFKIKRLAKNKKERISFSKASKEWIKKQGSPTSYTLNSIQSLLKPCQPEIPEEN